MNRLAVVVLSGALAAGAVVSAPAHAGRKPRFVFEEYSPVGINTWIVGYADPGVSLASVELEARPGEKTVSIALKDDSGYVVRGSVRQAQTTLGDFCGETREPIRIDPTEPVEVSIFTGTCGGSWGLATEGGVTATFR